ncbi:TrmH family RNA methyltransferase [Vibrio sp. T187]|uniref:RNA methyltransferase n=1 Tax=Vibrio TaxID=662 RepID=UPI0010C9B67F|nr:MULTISPECIES: RNA methyltransferase [Vibrio]MBW3694775.1 TrmH family RNA methyltransferase [Vibrio sp. T187]
MTKAKTDTLSKGYACIGLVNPKTPENVGSVMRAAGCYGANSVFYTGTRYDHARQFHTDTKEKHLELPLIGVEDLKQIIPVGCVPVAVDLIEGAKPLPDYKHPPRAFYIFGPEDGTLKKEITDFCRETIYVPTNGCMNLAAAVNVILYDRMSKGDNFSNHLKVT